MRILILNRRPIVEKIASWFKKFDAEIFLITPASLRLADITGKPFKEIHYVDDYNAESVNELIVRLAGKAHIERIVSAAEIDVLRTARARKKLGLAGQNEESAEAYRNKWTMKSHLKRIGIPVASMCQITSKQSIEEFVEEFGFPIVIKPEDGGGSVGIQIIYSFEQLRRIDCASLKRGYIVEAWVNGDFFTIDGIMRNGIVLHCWPSRTTANFSAVNGESALLSWMLLPDDPLREKFTNLVTQTVLALPATPDTTAFHAEAFYCEKNQRMVLCEIACRPGGTGHVPVYEMAFGLNLYQETLAGQAGLRTQASYAEHRPQAMAGFAWFPPKRALLRYAPASCPIPGIINYQLTARVGQRYSAPHSIADHVAKAFSCQHVSSNPADAIQTVDKWWQECAVWE